MLIIPHNFTELFTDGTWIKIFVTLKKDGSLIAESFEVKVLP